MKEEPHCHIQRKSNGGDAKSFTYLRCRGNHASRRRNQSLKHWQGIKQTDQGQPNIQSGHFWFFGGTSYHGYRHINKVISSICPKDNNDDDDNQHYITIESTSSFIRGKHHSTSRIRRQSSWYQMTPSSIANSHSALNLSYQPLRVLQCL
ncbi:hypothetical protein ACHAWO_002107 [Cyclotella atomus]|uniref:Uncharacterized protein n=1 Tax=Cyclotella atomus TaxID=382360 RepID=A0ABD3Q0G9_9STRA